MSKLAAVRTVQPTQGMGTVPNGIQTQPSKSFSSTEEIADFLDGVDIDSIPSIELSNPLPGELPPPAINPRSAHSAAAATVTAAWLSLTATELEVRNYFRRIPVASGLEALAKMRKQCDMAAETLQQRMDENNTQRCTGCNKTLEEVRKTQWLMQGADTDPETGVPVPYRFCGPLCVRERNKERMLPKEERNKLRFDGQDMGEIR